MLIADSNIRVLIVSPSFATRGGIQNYCKTVLGYLRARVDVFVVGPHSESESRLLMIPRLILTSLQFAVRVVTEKYDLIHVNTSFAPGSLLREGVLMLAAWLTRTPVLVTFHGWSVDFEKDMTGMRLWLFRMAFSRADRLVVLAEDFKRALRRMGFSQDILIESTFVDDAIFRSVDESNLPLTNGHPKPFSMLFLSRILRQKGVFVVLESYRILKLKHKNLRLIVAGDGDDLSEARSFVEQHALEDVEFVGFVEGEDKKATLLRADAFVLPTCYGEGMPISMLEAMICGLPVISRPVGGIKDFFEQDRMGILVDGLEPAHYASAVERFVLDRARWNQVRLYNHRYARGRFLASSAADRLMNTYDTMIRTTNQEKR